MLENVWHVQNKMQHCLILAVYTLCDPNQPKFLINYFEQVYY